MKEISRRMLTFVGCLCVSLSSVGNADPGEHAVSLWQVDGQENQVFLLGSIHLLREDDYPLSDAIYDAYREAEVLYMELDMDDTDPVADQMLANELGLIQGDGTLRDTLGAANYREAERLAAAAQIPLELLGKAEPWYASIQVELIMLMRIGFNPQHGIESHLLDLSRQDGKEILGFETVRQQLEFLDNLSADAQQEMFMQALAEGNDLGDMMDKLIDAWHRGDSEYLEDNLLSDMQEYPELNRVIVVDRNVAWSKKIETLLAHDQDYLVVVGALHLVGEEGVPKLLSNQGYEVTQLRQSAGH